MYHVGVQQSQLEETTTADLVALEAAASGWYIWIGSRGGDQLEGVPQEGLARRRVVFPVSWRCGVARATGAARGRWFGVDALDLMPTAAPTDRARLVALTESACYCHHEENTCYTP